MNTYLTTLGLVAVFYGLHKIIVVHGKRWIYSYWVLSELLFLMISVRILTEDMSYILAAIFLQVFFIIFVKINVQNKDRNAIYDLMENIEFSLVLFLGIDRLEKKEYEQIKSVVENTIVDKFGFRSNVYLIIRYDDNKLTVNYIFINKDDLDLYFEMKKEVLNNIEEKEIIRNGASLSCIFEFEQ